MYKIKIFTVGKAKENWLCDALSEYESRLAPYLTLEWFLAKDDKGLNVWAEKESSFIALDPQGRTFTSEDFSKHLIKLPRLSLFIGGADGLSTTVKTKAKELWSLSLLTFTHQMTRIILLEQIYRAFEIERGSPYHK